jgi:hypothetical protein
MIELAVALADGNVNAAAIDAAGAALPAMHISSPKAGYWFQVQIDYAADATPTVVVYGNSHPDRFSFIAYPNSYGSSGKLVFILSEAGTMYKRDGESDVAIRPAGQPAVGVNDTGAVLDTRFNTFPFDPNAAGVATVAGPWSKMD